MFFYMKQLIFSMVKRSFRNEIQLRIYRFLGHESSSHLLWYKIN